MKEFKISPDVVDNVRAVGMSAPVTYVLYTLYYVYHTVACIVLCGVCPDVSMHGEHASICYL